MIMAGKDRGQVGTVLKVIRDPHFPRVVVEGLNLVRRRGGVGWGGVFGSAWAAGPPLGPWAHPAASPPPHPLRVQSKRHIKRTKDNPGGIVSVESPLHYSNVALLDPTTGVPCRVAWRYTDTGEKVGWGAGSAWEEEGFAMVLWRAEARQLPGGLHARCTSHPPVSKGDHQLPHSCMVWENTPGRINTRAL